MKPNKNYYALLNTKYKVFGLEGATWSGKTYPTMQYVVTLYGEILKNHKIKEVCHIFGETTPVLDEGMVADFKTIMIEEGHWIENNWNGTKRIYNFNGHHIRFLAIDKPSKAHTVRRDRMIADEAQNLKWEIISQLMGRTKKQVIFCFNPTHKFWYYTEIKENSDYEGILHHVHSTMFDNLENIPKFTLQVILARAKTDQNYKNIYVLGKIGMVEGIIISNYGLVDSVPENYVWKYTGLDFGYTNDQTAICDVYFANGELYVDERFYDIDLLNTPNPSGQKNIVDELRKMGKTPNDIIVADSAELKSIDEIAGYGFTMVSVKKPPGSVSIGIDIMKRYKINFTNRSLNAIFEVRNWRYAPDKQNAGKFLNEEIKVGQHIMTCIRYICYTYLRE